MNPKIPGDILPIFAGRTPRTNFSDAILGQFYVTIRFAARSPVSQNVAPVL